MQDRRPGRSRNDELYVALNLPHHYGRIAFGPVVVKPDAQLVFTALDQAHCDAGVAIEAAVVVALHIDRFAVDILEHHHHRVGPPEGREGIVPRMVGNHREIFLLAGHQRQAFGLEGFELRQYRYAADWRIEAPDYVLVLVRQSWRGVETIAELCRLVDQTGIERIMHDRIGIPVRPVDSRGVERVEDVVIGLFLVPGRGLGAREVIVDRLAVPDDAGVGILVLVLQTQARGRFRVSRCRVRSARIE